MSKLPAMWKHLCLTILLTASVSQAKPLSDKIDRNMLSDRIKPNKITAHEGDETLKSTDKDAPKTSSAANREKVHTAIKRSSRTSINKRKRVVASDL